MNRPMRQPTPRATLYAWHGAAMRGERPPMRDGDPQCGWFRRRMVKGGPWVAARIWCEREIDPATGDLASDEVLRCEVGGDRRDPYREWTWICGQPISRETYDELRGLRDRNRWMEATHVAIDPTKEPIRP